jgi:phage anti-repressor protein
LELNPSNFARWAITNIESDDFYTKNVDWVGVFIAKSGNEVKDYQLTIDFAKHLCMLSRSDKGKQARSYFVEVEKRANKPACIEDMMIAQLQGMKEVRLQLEQNSAGLADVKNDMKQLEAKVTTISTEYYTVAGFASLRGLKFDNSKTNLLGRKATKMSNEYGIDTGKAYNAQYGQVNTYHIDILEELFKGV